MNQLRTPDENKLDAVRLFMLKAANIGINRSAGILGSAIRNV